VPGPVAFLALDAREHADWRVEKQDGGRKAKRMIATNGLSPRCQRSGLRATMMRGNAWSSMITTTDPNVVSTSTTQE